MNSIKSAKPEASKVTRAQITVSTFCCNNWNRIIYLRYRILIFVMYDSCAIFSLQAQLVSAEKRSQSDRKIVQEDPLIENVNRLQIEGVEARTVDEALKIFRYFSVHYSTPVYCNSILLYSANIQLIYFLLRI